MTKLYITEALRWGDDENHSYVVGVYSTREKAEYAGTVEKSWRGGKYEPRVTKATLDEVEDKKEKVAHHNDCMWKGHMIVTPADEEQ